jgi:NTE family protein
MADWMQFLQTVPIFSFFKASELSEIQTMFEEVVFEKGESICEIGDEGDTFYVVVSGELEVWGGANADRLVNTLGPRDFFGEMVLLQGGRRTATIKASRRARLLALARNEFESLFMKNPKAIEYFARVLCKRLASTTKGAAVRRANTVISIISRPGMKGKTLVSSTLAGILADMTHAPVLLVHAQPGSRGLHGELARLVSDDLENIPEDLRTKLASGPTPAELHLHVREDKPPSAYAEAASNLVSRLSDMFPILVFDMGLDMSGIAETVNSFSDIVIEIVDAPDSRTLVQPDSTTKVLRVINLENATSKRIAINRCEPYVIPKDSDVKRDIEGAPARLRLNGRLPPALPMHRMARKILGTSVGIALGGGAAFGIAHLGVLKVLEDNQIPIDLVAGCSQGSIIGAGYAAGIPVDTMIATAHSLGKLQNFFSAMDLTFTKPGILGGRKVIELFGPMLGGRDTFEDLVIPYRAIATDIESGEGVAIGTGRLDSAFRASSSVPGVFAPFKLDDRALVDGGVADPCPAGVVQKMGADLCIAVNVVPPLKKGLENVVSKIYRQVNRLNPLSYLGESSSLPNLFDIIMNSMQVLQYELGNFKAISADVLINPDLSEFTWVEYYRAEELIQRGAQAAERVLPAIRKSIEERLAKARPPAPTASSAAA